MMEAVRKGRKYEREETAKLKAKNGGKIVGFSSYKGL